MRFDNLTIVRRKLRDLDQTIKEHQEKIARHQARLDNLTEMRRMLVRRERELEQD